MISQQDNARREREKDSQEERMLLRMKIGPDAREQNRLKRVHEMMEQIYLERSNKKLSEELNSSNKHKDFNDRNSSNGNFRTSTLSSNPPKLHLPARPMSPQHTTLDFTDQNLITGSLIQETYDSNEFFKLSTKKIRHAISTANSLFHYKKKQPEFLAIPDPDDLNEVVNYSEKKRSKAQTIKERVSQLTSRKTSVHDSVVVNSQNQGIHNILNNSNPPVDQSNQRVNNLRASKVLGSPTKALSLENPSKAIQQLHNKSTSSERQMSQKEMEREGKLSQVRTKLGLLNADEKRKDVDLTIQKLQRQIDVIDNNIGLIQILPKLNKRKKFSYVLPNSSNEIKKAPKNTINSAPDNNNHQNPPNNSSNELKKKNCDNLIKNSTLNSVTSPYLTVSIKNTEMAASIFEDEVGENCKQENINLDCGANCHDKNSQDNKILIDKNTKAVENDTKFKVFFKQNLDPPSNLKQALSPSQKLQIRTASVPIKYRQRVFSDHSTIAPDTCKNSPNKNITNEATFYIPKLQLPIERWGNHQMKHNDDNINAKVSHSRQTSNLINFPHSTTSFHVFNKSLNKGNFRNNNIPYSSFNRNSFYPWSTSNRAQGSEKSTEGEEQHSANRTVFNNGNVMHNSRNSQQNAFVSSENSNKLAKKASSVKAIKLINDMGQLQRENEENGKKETAYAASQVKLIKKDLLFWESEFNEYNTVADKNLLKDIYVEMKEKDLAEQEHQ